LKLLLKRAAARPFSQAARGSLQNWRGKPLVSHEVTVNLIAATTTRTGLKVWAKLDTNAYPSGVKASEK
jgi:hypothetical protein